MSTRISFTLLHILCNQNVCCLFNISVRLIVLNISCAFIEVLTEWIFICVVNLYRSHNLSIINFWCDNKTVILMCIYLLSAYYTDFVTHRSWCDPVVIYNISSEHCCVISLSYFSDVLYQPHISIVRDLWPSVAPMLGTIISTTTN